MIILELITWPLSINQLFQYIGYMSVNGFAPSTDRTCQELALI